MWKLLKGEKNNSVTLENFKGITTAVLNFDQPWMHSNKTIIEEEQEKIRKATTIGAFDERNNLTFTTEEI